MAHGCSLGWEPIAITGGINNTPQMLLAHLYVSSAILSPLLVTGTNDTAVVIPTSFQSSIARLSYLILTLINISQRYCEASIEAIPA